MNILRSEVLCCIFGTLVQGWRTCVASSVRVVPARFKTGMSEMKILGSEVLWCVFGTLVQDQLAPMHGVICSGLFRQSSKQGCVR